MTALCPPSQALGLSHQTLESACDASSGTLLLADEDGGGSHLVAVDLATRAARWATPRGSFRSSCNGIAVLPATPGGCPGLVFASAFFEDALHVHRLADGMRLGSVRVRRPESLAADAATGTVFVATIVSGSYSSIYAESASFGVAAWRWLPGGGGGGSSSDAAVAAAAPPDTAIEAPSLPLTPRGGAGGPASPRGSAAPPPPAPPAPGEGGPVTLLGAGSLVPLGIIAAAGVGDTCRPLAVLSPPPGLVQHSKAAATSTSTAALTPRGGGGHQPPRPGSAGSTGSVSSSTRSVSVARRDATPSPAAFASEGWGGGGSVLLVGSFAPPAIRVLSLPDCALLRTHRLPPASRVAGLAADPSGTAVVVMDSGPSAAAVVMPWPLPLPLVLPGEMGGEGGALGDAAASGDKSPVAGREAQAGGAGEPVAAAAAAAAAAAVAAPASGGNGGGAGGDGASSPAHAHRCRVQ